GCSWTRSTPEKALRCSATCDAPDDSHHLGAPCELGQRAEMCRTRDGQGTREVRPRDCEPVRLGGRWRQKNSAPNDVHLLLEGSPQWTPVQSSTCSPSSSLWARRSRSSCAPSS